MVIRRRQDVTDPYQDSGPGNRQKPWIRSLNIVTQQSGQVLHWHLCHTGGINGQLDRLDHGIRCHVPLQLAGQDGP